MVAERMMLVGEAWGAEEAVAGRPFVGVTLLYFENQLTHGCHIHVDGMNCGTVHYRKTRRQRAQHLVELSLIHISEPTRPY